MQDMMCHAKFFGNKQFKISNIFFSLSIYINQRWTRLNEVINEFDTKDVLKFEKSIKEILSIYLINSAYEQGLIEKKIKDYIIHKI